MKDLHVPFQEFTATSNYSTVINPTCNVKKTFLYLKNIYKNSKNPKEKSGNTFKQFAEPLLGSELYEHFVTCSGYSDYENEDAYDTFYHYGFDDNYSDWTGLSISWKKVIEKLVEKIGYKNIITCCNVVDIKQIMNENEYGFNLKTEKGTTYSSKKVIMATTIQSVLKLVPGAKERKSIYQQIHGQPFLRIYAKFSKSSIPIMQHFVPKTTIVPGPIHKIIPINPENGIYMIVYTDNKDAEYVKKYKENTPKNRDFLANLLESSLGLSKSSLKINSMIDFYWTIGTHYYEPLKEPFSSRKEFIRKAQHPIPGMLIVGEMIALHQGWVEGALESVEDVVTKKWIQK